ncbi:CatB-related O-acetyltransferase [Spirosoma endophyticum]|uniref:Acetyltransferase (Isoleucine patch superfamily) n=1 Tax=Spirosoma endophyticum TaxID=662367 RepID=A0A1I1Q5W1_9BACT|nr:CatB-related O-acetyltransferase [Spirosoma endophyticum]SFD13520.1 Acetyltransferase (isoleucine patch superfamily) [Spirosoma endophyticum]
MNFIKNLYNFIKHLSQQTKIDWSSNLQVEEECYIDNGTRVNGNHNFFRVKIGFGSLIGKSARISYTTIGKFCSIGPNFLCGWGIHPISGISTNAVFYSTAKQNGFTYSKVDKIAERQPIKIGNDVFIGANVTVLDGVTIGDGAVIGAGAIVSKDIPPYAIAVGCPIKVIKYRFTPEIIEELLSIQWWDKNEETLKKVEKHFWDVNTFLEEIRKMEARQRQLS